jgi:hypothetical protein
VRQFPREPSSLCRTSVSIVDRARPEGLRDHGGHGRFDTTTILTTLRRKKVLLHWLDAYRSTDNGRTNAAEEKRYRDHPGGELESGHRE